MIHTAILLGTLIWTCCVLFWIFSFFPFRKQSTLNLLRKIFSIFSQFYCDVLSIAYVCMFVTLSIQTTTIVLIYVFLSCSLCMCQQRHHHQLQFLLAHHVFCVFCFAGQVYSSNTNNTIDISMLKMRRIYVIRNVNCSWNQTFGIDKMIVGIEIAFRWFYGYCISNAALRIGLQNKIKL